MYGRLFEGVSGRATNLKLFTFFFFPLEGSPTWFKVLGALTGCGDRSLTSESETEDGDEHRERAWLSTFS